MKTDNYSGPQEPHLTHRVTLPYSADESDSLSDLKAGWSHEIGDLVNLELAAEQMLSDEAQLAGEYVKDDVSHFWRDVKESFIYWELATGQLLLTAADPTRVDWQEHHWWGDDESQFH